MLENTNSESNIPEATATYDNMEIKDTNAMTVNNTISKITIIMIEIGGVKNGILHQL